MSDTIVYIISSMIAAMSAGVWYYIEDFFKENEQNKIVFNSVLVFLSVLLTSTMVIGTLAS